MSPYRTFPGRLPGKRYKKIRKIFKVKKIILFLEKNFIIQLYSLIYKYILKIKK
jgi:hypothetical protein